MSGQAYRAAPADSTRPEGSGAQGQEPLRIAYVVSRFPKTTETFVVRELNVIAANPEISAKLYSLFPPVEGSATIHPGARPWLERIYRPTIGSSVRAFLRWTWRRPVRMFTTLCMLGWGFRHEPRKLVGSLAAMVIGCALADQMREDRIEHVHAHFIGHPATAAWVIRRLAGIEYSVTAHAYELYQDNEFLRPRVLAARFVATISQFNADFLFQFCKGMTPPIAVIRAGIALEDFPYRPRSLPQSGVVKVLAVGSLIDHKGHRVLIEALSRQDPVLDRIRVTIVGDGPERPRLEQAIQAANLGERVSLVGSCPEDEVSRLMQESDLFVLPSLISATGRMEGIPVVLMEAMASGVPVIATRLSGIPELVVPSVTGTLAEQGDADSLADAIISTLSEPDRAREMAVAARRRVETGFDVRRSAAQLAERFLAMRRVARTRGNPRRPAFVAWSQSARSRELAAATGSSYNVVYMKRLGRLSLVPVRYMLSSFATAWFLLRRRPSVVVATNPPIFPALIAYLLSPFTGSELVLDSHPRGFGYKSSVVGRLMAPLHRYLIRRARATLVASHELADVVTRCGGEAVILHEAPPFWAIETPAKLGGRPQVLWVTIFAADEPVETVLEAARQLPEVDFKITGDLRRCPPEMVSAAPENIEFTGFWADEGFARLISSSDVMLVLTTERASVPRAAFEAVQGLRPLVLSDFPELRDQFPNAIFVNNSASGIADGIREAVSRHEELAGIASEARKRQRHRWYAQLRQLEELLRAGPGDGS
jgi:glycosyltransferase involved in cell wall biosynthesis